VIPETGEQILRLTAIAGDASNAPRQVVVDSSGEPIDLDEIEARVGRRLFIPEIGALVAALEPPARVTIDPPVNDLVLERCRRESERITATIPKSGATRRRTSTCSRTRRSAWSACWGRSARAPRRSSAPPRSRASTSPTAWGTTRT
jgi:hypothetical protein